MLITSKKIHHAIFELLAPKAVIKGVFSRSYCCYGNLLSYENDNNVFINGWAVFWYQTLPWYHKKNLFISAQGFLHQRIIRQQANSQQL